MQKIFKVGNSKGVTIPKAYADQLGLEEGTQVELRLNGKEIVLRAARKKYSLEELVSKMRPEHNIPELITGEFGAEKLEYKSRTEVVDESNQKSSSR